MQPSLNQYDDDDEEADTVWVAIDERMNAKRREKNHQEGPEQDVGATARARIGAQFQELNEQPASSVPQDDWMKIPQVGDHSLKFKNHKSDKISIRPLRI
jgi:pre-mRNA-processing factor 6